MKQSNVDAVAAALGAAFPEPARVEAYTYTPYSIRVRVISDRFDGKDADQRERMVLKALKAGNVPERVVFNVTMIVMMTPAEEAEGSNWLDLDFQHRTPKINYPQIFN